ncbi:DUF4624 family lipoprotein [Oscillibacter sp.]|uniref:DUF4624 family lipoprotein n=1 Tax=Oscillibacter sp. TaxID=1945593 RepID=UPI00289863F3|nr:DUF4624 family lipoprotein [Oscillibacter sp.]
MKNFRIVICFLMLITIASLVSCSNISTKDIKLSIDMELTEDYDEDAPFIDERLIYVSEDAKNIDLNVSFQMTGESGILEIADNATGEIFWSESWDDDVSKTAFIIPLAKLQTEREYVIRFTGTKITYAKIEITSDSSFVKEQEKPLKPNRS